MQPSQSQLICLGNKKAINICGSEDCHQNGLMCKNEDCQCQCDRHLKCPSFKLKGILIDLKAQSLTNQEQKSLETIENIFTQQIEQLAIYRQQTRIKKYTLGLKENSLKLFTLINERHLQQLTGSLIYKTINELKTPKQNYSLKSHLQILKFWQEKKNQFKKFCQTIKLYPLSNNSQSSNAKSINPTIKSQHKNILPNNHDNNTILISQNTIEQKNSSIAASKSKVVDNLDQFINWIGRKIINMKLLYRASEDNFSVQTFHKKCDKIKNTLLLIKTNFNKIIGGFTNLTWNSVKNNFAADYDNKTFLFSYTNKEKYL